MISQFIRSHKSSESEVGEDVVLMGKKKDSDSSELAELLKEINLSEKQYLNFGSIWRLVQAKITINWLLQYNFYRYFIY